MGTFWPRAEDDWGYAVLVAGAPAAFVGLALLLPRTLAPLVAAVAAFALFSISIGTAIHHLSPRLAHSAPYALVLGAASLLVAAAVGGASAAWLSPLGEALAWLGVGGFAAAQWFDNRRTFGMAGLGFLVAALGLVGTVTDAVFAYSEGWVAAATSAFGGTPDLWRWIVVPQRLAFALAVLWSLGTARWLIGVHAKRRAAVRRAATTQQA